MSTRSTDPRLGILGETPGCDHLAISGTRLPTYKQVLFSYLANVDKLRREDKSKNEEITWTACKNVVLEVKPHYEKAHVMTVSEKRMTEKVKELNKEYTDLRKVLVKKRTDNPRISKFQDKLGKTMPFWPKAVETLMEESKKGKKDVEKIAIAEDIAFLKSMMTDRLASYTTVDNTTSKLEENRLYFTSLA